MDLNRIRNARLASASCGADVVRGADHRASSEPRGDSMSAPGSRTSHDAPVAGVNGPDDDAEPSPTKGDQTCCAPAVDATDTNSATVEAFVIDDE